MEGWSKEEILQKLRKRDEIIAELRQANALLQQENALLRQKIDLLVRRVFGKSSETMSAGQLDLFLLGENPPKKGDASWLEEAAANHREQKPKAARGPRGKARWPEDLPVVEEVIEPEEVKANPADWRRIGEERTERLDYQPARFFRQVTVRPKYVERALPEAAPVIAELPPSLQDRGTAAPPPARANPGRQVLRSPAALPAGTNLRTPPRSLAAAPKPRGLGGVVRVLAATHLRGDQSRGF